MVNLKVILPSGIKLEQECSSVTIPGLDGDFAVLEGHTSFMSKIRPGIMTVENGGNEGLYAMHDGFVTVEDDMVILVCDRMESTSDIDKNRAEDALKRAKKRLQDVNNSDIDFRRAEFALRRAMTRIATVK